MLSRLLTACVLLASTSYSFAERTITVGGLISDAAPPFLWIDSCTGKHKGLMPHIIQEVFEELDIAIKTTPAIPMGEHFLMAIDQLQNKKIDAILAIYPTLGFEGMRLSQEPILITSDVIIFPATQAIPLESLSALKNKIGLYLSATAHPSESRILTFLKQQNLAITSVPSFDRGVELLSKGKADYLIADKYRATIYLYKNDLRENYSLYKPPIDLGRRLYFAMHEDSSWREVMPVLDKKLIEWRQSGYMELLKQSYMRDWINSPKCTQTQPRPKPFEQGLSANQNNRASE